MPTDALAFIDWFKIYKQKHLVKTTLFLWLATDATMSQMRWFLQQDAADEAGFDDLVALSQIKLPPQSKLELARNYWDEMSRGHLPAMHGLMLKRTVKDLDLLLPLKTLIGNL